MTPNCKVFYLYYAQNLITHGAKILRYQSNLMSHYHTYREWTTHKKWLQKLFQQFLMKRVGNEMSDSSQSVFNKVLAAVDKKNAPNYGVLLLWASQANATPVSCDWGLCKHRNYQSVLCVSSRWCFGHYVSSCPTL